MKYLKIENLKSKTYYDKDQILFHAMFQVLVDFVEKELVCHENMNISKILDIYGDEIHTDLYAFEKDLILTRIQAMYKIIGLYDWYMFEEKHKDTFEYNEMENKKLKELVDVKNYMWT